MQSAWAGLSMVRTAPWGQHLLQIQVYVGHSFDGHCCVTDLRGAKSFEFEPVLKTAQKQRKDLGKSVSKISLWECFWLKASREVLVKEPDSITALTGWVLRACCFPYLLHSLFPEPLLGSGIVLLLKMLQMV